MAIELLYVRCADGNISHTTDCIGKRGWWQNIGLLAIYTCIL